MTSLVDNPIFQADYQKLQTISLNPVRHAAPNAYEHCEMVRQRVIELATLNDCTDDEIALLSDLARVHDIGKISGTTSTRESMALLLSYGVTNERLISLVKYHDTNLPWYQSVQRGEAPKGKVWNRLARKVDLRLLCLFMVADRVDCPGGWRSNRPLVWFLEEVNHRSLLDTELILNDGPVFPAYESESVEVSVGGVLVRRLENAVQALVIRVREGGYEVPKGHIEPGEAKERAALREIREETGLASSVTIGPEIGFLEYSYERCDIVVRKQVHHFLAFPPLGEPLQFGRRPSRTNELRWVTDQELSSLPLVNDDLRPIIARAFGAFERINKKDTER